MGLLCDYRLVVGRQLDAKSRFERVSLLGAGLFLLGLGEGGCFPPQQRPSPSGSPPKRGPWHSEFVTLAQASVPPLLPR